MNITILIITIIVIVLIIGLYMNQYSIMDEINKMKAAEHFTQLSNEAIQDIQTVANIYKTGTMTLSNLHVTGNLAVDGTNGGIIISPNGNLQANNTNINGNLNVTGTSTTNNINNTGLLKSDKIEFPNGWVGIKGTSQGAEFYNKNKTNCTIGLIGGNNNGVWGLGGVQTLPSGFCTG